MVSSELVESLNTNSLKLAVFISTVDRGQEANKYWTFTVITIIKHVIMAIMRYA